MGLKLTGVVLGFEVEGDVSLKPLVEQFGFSKPEKKDTGSVTSTKHEVLANGGSVDYSLTRKGEKFLFSAKASYELVGEDVDYFTARMLEQLEAVGL